LAATFAAVLELAHARRIELRQERAFGPIHLRSRSGTSSGLREIPG
jgi:chromatin segregation and condensation protein Rec8/ScpA/Scc1 (kleisin family)